MHLLSFPLRVTLTAKNFDYDETDSLRQVMKAWVKLKALRWFKARVTGGVTAFEITDIGNGWHVHCHGLWNCQWLSVTTTPPPFGAGRESWNRKGKASSAEVGQQWELCCGRRASVHVRRVWKHDGGDIGPSLADTLKYSVKGSDLVAMKHRVGPLISMLDRTRMIRPFGSLHGHPDVRRVHPTPKPCDCGACGAFQPEDIVLGTATDSNGLTDRQRRKRR